MARTHVLASRAHKKKVKKNKKNEDFTQVARKSVGSRKLRAAVTPVHKRGEVGAQFCPLGQLKKISPPTTADIVAKCTKLLESALYLDVDGLSYNTAINKLLHNLGKVDDYEEYENACYGIREAMESLCCKAPQRIDHLLRLYYRLVDREPVRRERRMFDEPSQLMKVLDECPDFLNRRLHYGEWVERCPWDTPGGVDSEDASKLMFSEGEVEHDFERVKVAVHYQAEQQNASVIGAAIFGRHAALLVSGVCESEGVCWDSVDDIGINDDLARIDWGDNRIWSTSESMALLLKVRGMAKSLFSKPGVPSYELLQKKDTWIAFLKRWLWDDTFNVGNDRLVKHHVMVSRFNTSIWIRC